MAYKVVNGVYTGYHLVQWISLDSQNKHLLFPQNRLDGCLLKQTLFTERQELNLNIGILKRDVSTWWCLSFANIDTVYQVRYVVTFAVGPETHSPKCLKYL